ncbi:MAG: DUF4920 domain-containing protein [Bacteroidetes Order II. Incertae sedis bacterium]|jgi:hypothetical protein|nr:DUF4920 domain-containing protein [Bacteroidetes Order II. bacterium]MBT4051836.1 DUF4920 domain-containing protein [Bacteroidetes Order II. bacterium]MBT4603300.1 DUF4920 domain-containing protein [Bacteroidetes Order II. bacterium]MBT5249520.1 DUF4920 domain-containing protein [Bacteroidetes Order II. bacterium]MBT6201561.1 DUF4920 domain-containing protein [Bacteroidetes Order II. bacterium]
MKKLLLAALVALTFSACQTDRASESSSDVADSASGTLVGTTYGEALTLTDVTPVSLILDNPNDFVGETVLVEGMVVGVCENKGCWLDIASDRDYEKIQVKVDDGVIVFPMTARGHKALVQGNVEELQLTAEQAFERAKHYAEEQGMAFDSTATFGPETVYRIRGLGAVIAD